MGNNGFKKVENNKNGFRKVKTIKERNIYVGKVACPSCGSLETSAKNPGTSILIAGATLFAFGFIGLFACVLSFVFWWAIPLLAIGTVSGIILFGIGTAVTGLINDLTFKCDSCGSVHKINLQVYKIMAREAMSED